MKDALAELSLTCSGRTDSPTDDHLRRLPTEFFEPCYHVWEHIASDPAAAVASTDVQAFIQTAPNIQLARDVANTAKHHTRSRGREVRVTNERRRFDPLRVSYQLEWKDSGTVHTADALDVAQNAVAEWRTFFNGSGLSES